MLSSSRKYYEYLRCEFYSMFNVRSNVLEAVQVFPEGVSLRLLLASYHSFRLNDLSMLLILAHLATSWRDVARGLPRVDI